MEKEKYKIFIGTVQAHVAGPDFWHSLRFIEYQRELPILRDKYRVKLQLIVDKMNSGELSLEEAKKELDKV